MHDVLEDILSPELAMVPDALIVPLGNATSECLGYLSSAGLLKSSRCLFGFPHPSGANGHRKSQFEAEKHRLRSQLKSWFKASPAA